MYRHEAGRDKHYNSDTACNLHLRDSQRWEESLLGSQRLGDDTDGVEVPLGVASGTSGQQSR
ncbi:hypothetical protein PGTUg99_019430 [Puccinia graminis f. sp. tritici]|uniref:Uncharacterized protein n=1 Tax=Puccinia graminis f. sp. tritici TaxID=56615 RepID=A0A5B0M459_PUCGR|nr:hypothetical protein PGTUg99_019430 [Puccinia graminis f. sp. tritici]